MASQRMSGSVQVGGRINATMYQTLPSGRVVCDIWADVIPSWGNIPKPGARWHLTIVGADSVDELREKVRAEIKRYREACMAGLILGCEWVSHWPYAR